MHVNNFVDKCTMNYCGILFKLGSFSDGIFFFKKLQQLDAAAIRRTFVHSIVQIIKVNWSWEFSFLTLFTYFLSFEVEFSLHSSIPTLTQTHNIKFWICHFEHFIFSSCTLNWVLYLGNSIEKLLFSDDKKRRWNPLACNTICNLPFWNFCVQYVTMFWDRMEKWKYFCGKYYERISRVPFGFWYFSFLILTYDYILNQNCRNKIYTKFYSNRLVKFVFWWRKAKKRNIFMMNRTFSALILVNALTEKKCTNKNRLKHGDGYSSLHSSYFGFVWQGNYVCKSHNEMEIVNNMEHFFLKMKLGLSIPKTTILNRCI